MRFISVYVDAPADVPSNQITRVICDALQAEAWGSVAVASPHLWSGTVAVTNGNEGWNS